MSSEDTLLEAVVESISSLPNELKRNLDLMKDLDKTCSAKMEELRRIQIQFVERAELKMKELKVVEIKRTSTKASSNDEKSSGSSTTYMDQQQQHGRKRSAATSAASDDTTTSPSKKRKTQPPPPPPTKTTGTTSAPAPSSSSASQQATSTPSEKSPKSKEKGIESAEKIAAATTSSSTGETKAESRDIDSTFHKGNKEAVREPVKLGVLVVGKSKEEDNDDEKGDEKKEKQSKNDNKDKGKEPDEGDIIIPTTEEMAQYLLGGPQNAATIATIHRLQTDALQMCDEKVAISRQTYRLVDAIVKRLDHDINKLEKILKANGEFDLMLHGSDSDSGGGVNGGGTRGHGNAMGVALGGNPAGMMNDGSLIMGAAGNIATMAGVTATAATAAALNSSVAASSGGGSSSSNIPNYVGAEAAMSVQLAPNNKAPSDLAAVRVDDPTTGVTDQWILAKIINHRPQDGMYQLRDEDPESNKIFTLPATHVVLLSQQPTFHKGDVVFCIYPDTTSFYQATVIQAASKKAGGGGGRFVLVNFVDDADEHGITLPKAVSVAHVMRPPPS